MFEVPSATKSVKEFNIRLAMQKKIQQSKYQSPESSVKKLRNEN